MRDPLVYLITFTTYGARLHGDERGSVIRRRDNNPSYRLPPDAAREASDRALMVQDPLTLGEEERFVVAATIEEVCRSRRWQLHAVNVRSNHVHMLVTSTDEPEKVMLAAKAWATRRLREQGLVSRDRRVWAEHGSTRYVKTALGFERAAAYVLEGQGEDIGGVHSALGDK